IDDVDSAAPMAAPSGADTPAVYSPNMIVGRFLGKGVAVLHIGDSIGDGGDDTNGIGLNGTSPGNASLINGGGWTRRTATAAGLAFCNMTRGGNEYSWFQSQYAL